MTAREDILRRISRAIDGATRPVSAPRDYRASGALPTSVNLFVERVTDYRATVHRSTEPDVPALLATLLPGPVLVPTGVPVAWTQQLTAVRNDYPGMSMTDLDLIPSVLTTCAVAIAETGTVVLDAGSGQGRRALTLIPDHHVLVVRKHDIVANVPDALARLTPRRPQTWISGPSATSDIELDRVEGVHGPRRLELVVVE